MGKTMGLKSPKGQGRLAGSKSSKGSALGRKKTGQKKEGRPIAREFGAHLNAILERKGVTVPELAERLKGTEAEKSANAIWQIIRGESTPAFWHLPILAEVLQLKHWQDLIPPRK